MSGDLPQSFISKCRVRRRRRCSEESGLYASTMKMPGSSLLHCNFPLMKWAKLTHTHTHTTVTSCHHRTPSTHAHANKPHHFLCLSLRHLRTRFSSRGERQKTEQVNDACFPFLAHDWHNDTDVWIGHIKVTFRTWERLITHMLITVLIPYHLIFNRKSTSFHTLYSELYHRRHSCVNQFVMSETYRSISVKLPTVTHLTDHNKKVRLVVCVINDNIVIVVQMMWHWVTHSLCKKQTKSHLESPCIECTLTYKGSLLVSKVPWRIFNL